MKSPFISCNSRWARRGERGVTMVLVAVAMVAIIGMAAWSIDLVTLYLAREEAQRAADTAALTAARIISVSGITGTGDPANQTPYWHSICGGDTSVATLAAKAAGGQNSVGSIAANVTVKYATGDGSNATTDCSSGLVTAFAVNPLVTVQVQRTSLPTFFSRIWGNAGDSVSATATAEAFNPSRSNNYTASGFITPVQPRCVKPWMVPNQDPRNPAACSGGGCPSFVNTTDGSITNMGISLSGLSANGVIGETFTLFADCGSITAPCTAADMPLQADVAPTVGNSTKYHGNPPPGGSNLEYLPGEVLSASVGVPSCATAGTGGVALYRPAVSGCDQNTTYQCGVQSTSASPPNAIDLTENPAGSTGDTATGLACSLTSQTSVPLAGQDVLDTSEYPFKITAGSANPLKISNGALITSSNQIVSLPIYDTTSPLTFVGNRAEVTIVGFLQVFINAIDANGNINVTVLNVVGCGNGSSTAPNNAVSGSSPVPVRLITLH